MKLMKRPISTNYPALMGSYGHALPRSQALTFRVWVHPGDGEDYFYENPSYNKIKAYQKMERSKGNRVEPILGVFELELQEHQQQKLWEARLK